MVSLTQWGIGLHGTAKHCTSWSSHRCPSGQKRLHLGGGAIVGSNHKIRRRSEVLLERGTHLGVCGQGSFLQNRVSIILHSVSAVHLTLAQVEVGCSAKELGTGEKSILVTWTVLLGHTCSWWISHETTLTLTANNTNSSAHFLWRAVVNS